MQTKHLAVSVEKTLVLFRRRTVLLRKYFRVYLGVRTCCIFSLFRHSCWGVVIVYNGLLVPFCFLSFYHP